MTAETIIDTTFLSFLIGEELFAVNVGKVLEVQQKQQLTPIPNAPEYFKGVINFRGEIIPVVETRKKLNMIERTEEDKYVIIVMEIYADNKRITAGAIVDRVKDVISILPADVRPVPKMNKDFKTEYLKGIVRKEENFIMLIDFDKVLTTSELDEIHEFVEETQETTQTETN